MSEERGKKVAIGAPFPYRTLVDVLEKQYGRSYGVVSAAPVWRAPHVAQIACATPAANINLLHDRVSQAWTELDPSKERHICRGFRRHLGAVVMAKGAHIAL